MRVALFGSPSFAIPSLHALNSHHALVLVVSQADKPVGRGMKHQSPPTATAAKELGIPLAQPSKLRNNSDFHEHLEALELDVCITAAYGKILPKSLLSIPKHGFLNIHGSLLPKYRGAAPIQWALINGEKETGISIMQTEVGLDTGPVRHVVRLSLKEEDTSLSVFNALSDLGSKALLEALALLEQAKLPMIPQDDSKASHAPMLTKEDGKINWEASAKAIYNRYQGVKAWPGTWTLVQGKVLKIHEMQRLPSKATQKAGKITAITKDGLEVSSIDKTLLFKTVQAPNKPKMPAYDWANGYQIKEGDTLG